MSAPRLVTHGGKFHCDEVFGYAVLCLALGLSEPGRDHILVRTRKPELIAEGDIVWDVGSQFDVATGRFDHHQRGAPLRADGIPFSAAGLLWQVYGERAVAAVVGEDAAAFAATIAASLDAGVVHPIDEIDNGVCLHGKPADDSLGLARMIGDFNPVWSAPEANGPTAGDGAFLAAADVAKGFLVRRIGVIRARLAADAIVCAAHAAGADPRVLVLDRGMPWKSAVLAHHLPVLFTVSPASNGNWMIDTMPPEPDSFSQRLPLPEAWAGLPERELAAVTGVPDAVFVHLRRFVAAARSREGALAMAHKALALS